MLPPFIVALIGKGNITLSLDGLSGDTIASTGLTGSGNRARSGLKITKAEGQVQSAIGDTGSALSYSEHTAGASEFIAPEQDVGAWEAQLVIDSTSGAAGTMTGTTGSYVSFTGNLEWVWTKDADLDGTATANVTLTIRYAATPAWSVSCSLTMTAQQFS